MNQVSWASLLSTVPVNISKSARVLTLYHHRGSWEVNREGGMKYFYENQLKPMLLILCYEIKGDIQKENSFHNSAKQQLKPL